MQFEPLCDSRPLPLNESTTLERHIWLQQQVYHSHRICLIDERESQHMFVSKPPFARTGICKCFRRYRHLRPKPAAHQGSDHLDSFLRSEIDSQINIRSQSGVAMQHRGETAHDNIAHSRRIQYVKYGFEDRHGAILADQRIISSRAWSRRRIFVQHRPLKKPIQLGRSEVRDE